jgi:hypothetical protein
MRGDGAPPAVTRRRPLASFCLLERDRAVGAEGEVNLRMEPAWRAREDKRMDRSPPAPQRPLLVEPGQLGVVLDVEDSDAAAFADEVVVEEDEAAGWIVDVPLKAVFASPAEDRAPRARRRGSSGRAWLRGRSCEEVVAQPPNRVGMAHAQEGEGERVRSNLSVRKVRLVSPCTTTS